MTHVENNQKKAKKIGAIALTLVILGGGGFGAYYGINKSKSEAEDPAIEVDDNKRHHIDDVVIKRDDEGNLVVEENKRDFDDLEQVAISEASESSSYERDFTHLEKIALAEAEERVANSRDFTKLEALALAEAKERNKGTALVRDEDGGLAFETNVNTSSDDKDLTASIDPEAEKPTEPEEPMPKPEKPVEPEPNPTPVEPEKPTEPEKPVNPVDPEKPTNPEKPINPVEPEKPTKPVEPEEPVITTDVIYKTDYLGFKVERIEDSTLEKGTEKVIQEGVAGNRTTKYKVTYKDGKEVNREVLEVNEKAPVNKVIHVGTKNLDELKNLVNEVDGFISDDYTEESWNVLLENLANAKNVLNDKDSSQKQVDYAEDQLQIAIDSLVKAEEEDEDEKEPETEEPEEEDEDEKEPETEEPEEENEDEKEPEAEESKINLALD